MNKYLEKIAERLRGGLADNIPDSEFDAEQLVEGIEVELEHTNDFEMAKEIAKDHLMERADYYERLEELEEKDEED